MINFKMTDKNPFNEYGLSYIKKTKNNHENEGGLKSS